MVVGSTDKWGGRAFTKRSSFLIFTDEDTSCLPTPITAVTLEPPSTMEYVNSLSIGLNGINYNDYFAGNEMVIENLAATIARKDDIAFVST